MRIVINSILPPREFDAVNLFGILFVRKGIPVTRQLIRHEKIHGRQMKELLFIFFYLFYLLEWIVKLFFFGAKSYENISFEREAYQHDQDPYYLKKRQLFSFAKYIFRKDTDKKNSTN